METCPETQSSKGETKGWGVNFLHEPELGATVAKGLALWLTYFLSSKRLVEGN